MDSENIIKGQKYNPIPSRKQPQTLKGTRKHTNSTSHDEQNHTTSIIINQKPHCHIDLIRKGMCQLYIH